ncbi:VOC family protein [Paenibacillus glycanilyticus]|uniref:VOC family protein n=1 Tax=Paenibacillus glycanilyticus TaxID=126569 RepID=A0ABQ6GJZ4_9BACL|nr:VOC family protein [Paenibacillus glycanilyticus]GLX71022.1 VOC family protein [Paenibacillus glycanilyticus]
MSVDAYLNFNGNCREAAEFYAEVFGLDKPKLMTFGEVPPNPEYPLPEEAKNMIMHTRLNIGGSNVMFSDVFPGMPFTVGNNITLAYVEEEEDKIRAAFDRLKVGGTIVMELQETFWSKLYGQITDKFGIQWQFNLGISEF